MNYDIKYLKYLILPELRYFIFIKYSSWVYSELGGVTSAVITMIYDKVDFFGGVSCTF